MSGFESQSQVQRFYYVSCWFIAVSFMSVWCFFFFLYIYIFSINHIRWLSLYLYILLLTKAGMAICIKWPSWDFNPPLCFSDFLSVFFVTLHALCHHSKVV